MQRTGTNPLSDLVSMVWLVRLLRRRRPGIVLNYGIKPVIYGGMAARLARVPRIFGMITGLGHAYTTQSVKTRLMRGLVTRLYRIGVSLSERVFFQNPDDEAEFLQRRILKDPTKAVRINGSGVNLDTFPEKPLPEGTPVFLFIGRLLTEKGIAEFVEAATWLKKRHSEARFVAVGPFDPNLPHSVASSDLETWRGLGTVEFIGGVKDVRPWLAQCTVFVLPSYREGTPRSVLEAMSVGRPIVTSDAPGCRETVVDGQNGFLVPPRQAAPLAEAMERFLEDPGLVAKMAAESRRIAEEKYDVRKVNRVILETMGLL
jgi:glycosyltransferase involved in cell wall biosynthesis